MLKQKITSSVREPGPAIIRDKPDAITRRTVRFEVEGRDGKTYRVRCGEDADYGRKPLSNEMVEEIRRAYDEGEGGYRALSKRFGVHRMTIRDIVSYRRRIRG